MEPVKLYVYDLSGGMAKQLSRQLTGRQIDGIWHTSIVVYGKEVFYGQGIDITQPGRSHHGSPLQIVDLGETAIDETTFNEYIEELREHYTAEKYHLLDFNCNSFTNDVAGFLTGGAIPPFIKDLPSDFLATPFGQALRPTIDSMYCRPSANATPARTPVPPANPTSDLTASILEAVASQAQRTNNGLPSTESLASPLHLCTNSASFNNIVRTHRAVVANFSNIVTCGPCRMIAPIYERLAEEKGVKAGTNGVGAAFIKVDMSTSMGSQVATEWGVRVMPTFMFFLDGKKIYEMKGADQNELRSQIDMLIFQAYPPHPHTSLSLPAVQALALKPILFTQVPALDAVANKLIAFIDASSWPTSASHTPAQVKTTITATIIPYLKSRTPSTNAAGKPNPLPSASPSIINIWAAVTASLSGILAPESIFPLVDMWRLGFLDPAMGTWSANNLTNPQDPLNVFLSKASASSPRNYTLTLIRMLSNAFVTPSLAQRMLAGTAKQSFTSFLIPTLLHEDSTVRTSAASLAFNASAFIQQGRAEKIRNGGRATAEYEDEDWEVEMVSAVVEALDREKDSEDVVHRLTASLACLLRASPFYETSLAALLEALEVRAILKAKLVKGGCGADGVKKADVKKLVEEVATKLCA